MLVQNKVEVVRRKKEWSKPSQGCMKFNVNGSAKAQPAGAAGIGGVLRDHNANVKLLFSESVGIVDSNLAELLAVLKALTLFSMGLKPQVVGRELFLQCCQRVYMPAEANGIADALAKSGVHRRQSLLVHLSVSDVLLGEDVIGALLVDCLVTGGVLDPISFWFKGIVIAHQMLDVMSK
ncbi:hypothetical protein PTKIN_Ptkin16aG0506800 [Pterospermum kingtungense]